MSPRCTPSTTNGTAATDRSKFGLVFAIILGVILAALAAQFVIDGLKQSFPLLA